MIRHTILFGILVVAATSSVLVGCNKTEPVTNSSPAPHKDGGQKDKGFVHKDGAHKDAEGHAHKPGAHGGVIVSLGKDSYHAEAVFDKDGVLRLYLLGKDEIKPQEIEVQDLVGHVTMSGSTDAVQVKFAAERQQADAAGKTSQFVATLPTELRGKKVKVTVNNIRVGSDQFRIEFSNEKTDKAEHDH